MLCVGRAAATVMTEYVESVFRGNDNLEAQLS